MNTQRISTSHAEPGMMVAEDIYSFSDQLIIGEGTALTDKMITRLNFYSIPDLLIRLPDEEADPLPAPATKKASAEYFSDTTYVSRIKHSTEFRHFSREFTKAMISYRGQINSIVENHENFNTTNLIKDVSSLFASYRSPGKLFDMMMGIRDLDDATYIHCMNVSLICCLFGDWLKLSDKDFNNLILAGLLHDIGKLLVPKKILTKPGKLTTEEYSIIKTHTLHGYSILKKLPIDLHVKHAALMHHERCDGTGYPMGLTFEKIDSYAKIVAIADVYDAMTAARVYRGPICPLEVLGIFESEGLQKYDPEYLLIFLKGVVHTYLHHTVLLSNGEHAEIIMINNGALSRPVVRTANDQFLDLSKESELSILGIL